MSDTIPFVSFLALMSALGWALNAIFWVVVVAETTLSRSLPGRLLLTGAALVPFGLVLTVASILLWGLVPHIPWTRLHPWRVARSLWAWIVRGDTYGATEIVMLVEPDPDVYVGPATQTQRLDLPVEVRRN